MNQLYVSFLYRVAFMILLFEVKHTGGYLYSVISSLIPTIVNAGVIRCMTKIANPYDIYFVKGSQIYGHYCLQFPNNNYVFFSSHAQAYAQELLNIKLSTIQIFGVKKPQYMHIFSQQLLPAPEYWIFCPDMRVARYAAKMSLQALMQENALGIPFPLPDLVQGLDCNSESIDELLDNYAKYTEHQLPMSEKKFLELCKKR